MRTTKTALTADDSIRPLLKKMLPAMAVLNVAVYLVTLLWGFDYTMIVGLAVGYGCCCLRMYRLAANIRTAVRLPVGKAKVLMFRQYLLHFLLLGILGYVALKFDFMNFAGLMLPQFYPRIVLGGMIFLEKRGARFGRT